MLTSIYVLPTEEGKPPRAIIGEYEEGKEPQLGDPIAGRMAIWSQDMGCWMLDGLMPLPDEFGEQITAHAKSLGVEW